ncbi:MAG: PA0069 family radical SAM protein [Burkholderiaceae bacterium]|nr:PA0069 family radical SAM protein [Burkholderiaceae bacterium]
MNHRLFPVAAIKGRGAATALAHRFTLDAREAFDDGWGGASAEHEAGAHAPIATQVRFEVARSALTHNQSPDMYFTQGLNPYRGCEHGCVYCYARPTHSYLNLSPGLDFETQIIAKRNLAAVLERELQVKSYRPSPVAIGTVTDAYQPCERELRITRSVLEVFSQCQHPLSIITKGSGVERDVDLLAPMAARGLATVVVTITTLDAHLARQLEPRAAAPHRRLRTIRTLVEAGIPVGVSVGPQIPFLNDDMEQVLEAAAAAGATSAFFTVLRLPWELNPLFQEWLDLHYPQRAARVMARVRDMHQVSDADRLAGKSYNSNFATRMKGGGVWADLLAQRFRQTCQRLGLNKLRQDLDVRWFDPSQLGSQRGLF